MRFSKISIGEGVLQHLKKSWFHVVLVVSLSVPILTLMVLDYLNMESFYVFNQEFRFLATFKGRMFYLFFLWLLFLESTIDWDRIMKKKPRNFFRIFAFLICAVIPLAYVLTVNFGGLDRAVLSLGEYLGVPERWAVQHREYALNFHWVLCFEYVIFSICSLITILVAYGKEGLGFFSIGLSLLVGMTTFYSIDTFFPAGSFKLFEMLALPTAACAAAVLDILGYSFILEFDTRHVHPQYGSMPIIDRQVGIGWPCAGVHSLFLFTVLTLVLFKRSNIDNSRKFVYFIAGVLGTYIVNVLRIVSYFLILWNNGVNILFWHLDARFFHNNVGELFFIFWFLIYFLIILSTEKFMTMKKPRIRSLLGALKNKFRSAFMF